ncbi:MAG: hypothetical protein Hyperionvirus1_192 [Hyperionvirus sp.]|uniref:Uncharacterized protein n=1 Tax=Hyperionvirus sp. TaxID=2487770 RepID=A0A3G5A9U7_9VIRU|nr:MAG: hypothetical protein Hyperionvirus1_192 [Hyperionvirus sp.]
MCNNKCGTICCYIIIPTLFLILGAIAIALTWPNYNASFTQECAYGIKNVNKGCICRPLYGLDTNGTCTIKLKSWITAAVCQTFFGFVGAGFAYIGVYKFFIAQLVGTLLLFLILVVLKSPSDKPSTTKFCIQLVCITAVFAGWMTSLALMWLNRYDDGSGRPLEFMPNIN